jgi:hypothetical protein
MQPPFQLSIHERRTCALFDRLCRTRVDDAISLVANNGLLIRQPQSSKAIASRSRLPQAGVAWPCSFKTGCDILNFPIPIHPPSKIPSPPKHPSIYDRKWRFSPSLKQLVRFWSSSGAFWRKHADAMLRLLAKMCRNGARENCPVQKCRFQHTTPAHVIYSTTPKGAVPPPPTPVTSPAGAHFPSAEHGARGWCGDVNAHAQHTHSPVENADPRDMNGSATAPSGALDADALAQGIATFFYCACLANG